LAQQVILAYIRDDLDGGNQLFHIERQIDILFVRVVASRVFISTRADVENT